MKAEDETLGASVRVFRAATAAPADGEATRARVLGLVERGRERRARWRRVGVVAVAVLASVTFGSAAWTALGRWRARTPAPVPTISSVAAPARHAPAPATAVALVDAPVTAPPPTPVVASGASRLASSPSVTGDAETRAYARAHEAHFTRDAPAEALAAWNRYLAAYPSGAFVPDARYNRALCMLRLGRHAAAAQALRPFADGAFHGYRRLEAGALLDWLARQPP
jgi:TolA-binding protein